MADDWSDFLATQSREPYWPDLVSFLALERSLRTVYPPEDQVFRALELTPPRDVRVVVLGQDPYHGPGQADGLAFSYAGAGSLPPSLQNIFRELRSDVPESLDERTRRCITSRRVGFDGDLAPWARRGVLLLNSALTVPRGEPRSHLAAWRPFVQAALRTVVASADVVPHFVLWGRPAKDLVQDTFSRLERPFPVEFPWFHRPAGGEGFSAQTSAHPSPLSCAKFYGTRPFFRANEALRLTNPGRDVSVDWSLS